DGDVQLTSVAFRDRARNPSIVNGQRRVEDLARGNERASLVIVNGPIDCAFRVLDYHVHDDGGRGARGAVIQQAGPVSQHPLALLPLGDGPTMSLESDLV